MLVSLQATGGDDEEHTVYMDPSDSFDYTPVSFKLRPGERQVVTANFRKTDSGLASINITSEGYRDYHYNLDGGFTGKLKALTPQVMEARHDYPVTITVVNSQDAAMHLDADAEIHVQAVNGVFNVQENGNWVTQSKISMGVFAGSSSTQAFSVRPTSITGAPVVLTAQLTPWRNDVVSSEQRLELAVLPAWWYTLMLAILGGCVPPIYRFLTAISDSGTCDRITCYRGAVKLLTGAVSGVVAFLFAAWDIIGVKLDMSSARTFLILGFLFSYVGVDVLIKRVLGQVEPKEDRKDQEPPKSKSAEAGSGGD